MGEKRTGAQRPLQRRGHDGGARGTSAQRRGTIADELGRRQRTPHDAPHTTSTGVANSAADWLDDHFEYARPEYEAQLCAVGIQPGWRVLDAACGAGSFLPWIADLVGPSGNIAALDLTPENVAVVCGTECVVSVNLGYTLSYGCQRTTWSLPRQFQIRASRSYRLRRP